MDENTNLQEQWEEIIARVLKLHARWKVADPDTYEEGIHHLEALRSVAMEMADSLQDRLWEREEAGRN